MARRARRIDRATYKQHKRDRRILGAARYFVCVAAPCVASTRSDF